MSKYRFRYPIRFPVKYVLCTSGGINMKKKLLAVLLAAAMISCFAAGCGGKKEDPAETKAPETTAETKAPAAGNPVEGGTLTVRVSADPLNINPLYVTDLNSFTIMQSLYAPFFEIVGGEVYYGNGLLQEVTANEDSTVFTMKLKEGLTWHDGEAITADDIVFSMETLVDESQAVPYSTYGFDGAGNVAVTEKVDDLTATITFKSSSTGFLGSLSQIYCIPKHIYEGVQKIGESELNYEPVGSGPFKFVSYQSGQEYVVERFDDYKCGDNVAHLDKVVFKIVKDTNSAIAALQSGDLNALTINSDDYKTVDGMSNVTINHYNSGQVNAMGMNTLKDGLSDQKVRQAISLAMNKEELVTFSYTSTEFATPAYSILTPDTLYYSEPETKYDNDQEQAKKLLKEAGAEGLNLSLLYSTADPAMEKEALYIQSKLGEVGITVTLDPQEDSVFKNTLQEPNSTAYDLVLENWELGAEPSLYADIIKTGTRSNNSNVSDADLDALWDQGLKTPNGEERAQIYTDIQNMVNDKMYIYTISYSNGFYALSNNFGGFDDFLLQTIYLDYSKLYAVE